MAPKTKRPRPSKPAGSGQRDEAQGEALTTEHTGEVATWSTDDSEAELLREDALRRLYASGLQDLRTSRRSSVLELVDFDSIEASAPESLWRLFIPKAAVTVLSGNPGSGKSTLSAAIAAAGSAARRLPGDTRARRFASLIVNSEDPPGLQRLRLEAQGWNGTGIHLPKDFGALRVSDPMSLASLAVAVEGFGIGLVVLDHLVHFVPAGVDLYRSDEMRRSVLGPLNALATVTGCSVLLVAQPTKAGDRSARTRVAGTYDIVAACRSALFAHRLPDGRSVLGISKSNWSRENVIVEYEIGSDGALVFGEVREGSINEIAREDEGARRLPLKHEEVRQALLSDFVPRLPLPSVEIQDELSSRGFSRSAVEKGMATTPELHRARDGLGPYIAFGKAACEGRCEQCRETQQRQNLPTSRPSDVYGNAGPEDPPPTAGPSEGAAVQSAGTPEMDPAEPSEATEGEATEFDEQETLATLTAEEREKFDRDVEAWREIFEREASAEVRRSTLERIIRHRSRGKRCREAPADDQSSPSPTPEPPAMPERPVELEDERLARLFAEPEVDPDAPPRDIVDGAARTPAGEQLPDWNNEASLLRSLLN